jgi:hypothetical protein
LPPTLLRQPKDASRTTKKPRETSIRELPSVPTVPLNPTLGKSNNLATQNARTLRATDVASGTTINTLRTSVLTVNATQSPVPTEEELIPTATATVKPHASKLINKDQELMVLMTPIEILKTESPPKLRKPSLIFSLKSSTDALPAASRNALTGKNDHVHLNKTLATSEVTYLS